ncbi:MAG: hypothetical protein IPL65_22075 [Lewinellaceae bacterium]|nr:hypothetical protein [Lewinellaceae bacterium]
MMKRLQSILLFLLLLLLGSSACNSKKICQYKPAPIFEKGLPHTSDYRYEQSGVQSLESMWLERGVLVEVYQEVCDATQQEFRFTVQGLPSSSRLGPIPCGSRRPAGRWYTSADWGQTKPALSPGQMYWMLRGMV